MNSGPSKRASPWYAPMSGSAAGSAGAQTREPPGAGHDAALPPRGGVRAQPEIAGVPVDKAGVCVPAVERKTYFDQLVRIIRVVADTVAGLVSRARCKAVEERDAIQIHWKSIGKRVGGTRRRLHTDGFGFEIGHAHARREGLRITELGGVVPSPELRPAAGDQG